MQFLRRASNAQRVLPRTGMSNAGQLPASLSQPLLRASSSYTDSFMGASTGGASSSHRDYGRGSAEFGGGWGPASLKGVKGVPRPGGRNRRGAPDDQWRIMELQNTISELPADFPHPAQLTAIVTAAAKQWPVPPSVGRAEVLLALAEKYMDKPCFTPPVVSALLHCMAQRGGPWAGRSHSAALGADLRWGGLLDTVARTLKFAPEDWDMRCLATTLFSLQKILATHASEEVRPLLREAGPTLLRLLHAEGGGRTPPPLTRMAAPPTPPCPSSRLCMPWRVSAAGTSRTSACS